MPVNIRKEYRIENKPQPHQARMKIIDKKPVNNTRKDKQFWPVFLSMEPQKTVKQVKVELRIQHSQLNPVKIGLSPHFQLFTQKLE